MNESIDREYLPKIYDAKYRYRIGAAISIIVLVVCIACRFEQSIGFGSLVIFLLLGSIGMIFQSNSCHYFIRPDYVVFRSPLAKFKLEYHEIVKIYHGDAGFCLQTTWGKVYRLSGHSEQVLSFLEDLYSLTPGKFPQGPPKGSV